MENQIEVRFKTTNEDFAVPDSTTSVPANVGPEKLNKLVQESLEPSKNVRFPSYFLTAQDKQFGFLKIRTAFLWFTLICLLSFNPNPPLLVQVDTS